MQPLDKVLRGKLERTIKEAREVAESAAKAALEHLGVGSEVAYPHLTDEEKALRRRLREHGRQLGDVRQDKGNQEIDRLIEEVAYEHWHRMLFARFLAENNLLMYWDDGDSENPVAIDLDTCQELLDEGAAQAVDKWDLAGRLATRMLPQIFRPDSPVFQLCLSPEFQLKLEQLVDSLPQDVFAASDSLGWVYQYWQSKRKDDINALEVKIGERELPAVTQLFTESYMVSYLLDNSIGAWWAKQMLTSLDLELALSEEELRVKASIPGLSLEFLRFSRSEDNTFIITSQFNNNWPDNLAELKLLDPCCGSGHFLVSALLMLIPMRMYREKINAQTACDLIISQNIHGLEIDQRCVELAAFAIALASWKYPGAGGYRQLPEFNLAWCGQKIGVKKDEWNGLADGDPTLITHMEELYDIYQNAPTLGSLINPRASFEKSSLLWKDYDEINRLMYEKLKTRHIVGDDLGVLAYGIEKAIKILSDKFHLIITNVPYLARSRQSEVLKKFCEKNYPNSKNDIATVFIERCMDFCLECGKISIVTPQNWLFQSIYKKFRENLLNQNDLSGVAWLGSGAFDTISGEVVQAVLLNLGKTYTNDFIIGIDVTSATGINAKMKSLCHEETSIIFQSKQKKNPDCMIVINSNNESRVLGDYANSYHGITTTDYPRFGRRFWELQSIEDKWVYQQSTVSKTALYGGLSYILLWENGLGGIKRLQQAGSPVVITGLEAWGSKGISVNQMNELNCAMYTGTAFDTNVAIIIPKKKEWLAPIYAFCSSPNFNTTIRKFNQSMKVEYVYYPKVAFDFEYWNNVSKELFPDGVPKPYSDDPTQWIFHGNPTVSEFPLQVAVARLMGYKWPAELDGRIEVSEDARAMIVQCDELKSSIDDDGIICIPSVRGEPSAAERLMSLLATALNDDDINTKVADMLKSSDHSGKSLDSWLRDKFFGQHCKIFDNRPFIWNIWDGLSDGFSVLVNYHKLDHKNLENLIYTYLGDWISAQKKAVDQGVDGAQEKLDAAEVLKVRLEKILEGQAPYDIFVRWKSLEQQPIGWDPDLNDGVRLNIRPFMSVPDVRKKGAGILRDKPNIKWDKDRGKDTKSSPWYSVFKGDRINDYHLTIEEKLAASKNK